MSGNDDGTQSITWSFGGAELTAEAGAPAGELAEDAPFRILVLGDFGGSSQLDDRIVSVDRDNFDDVFARFGVTVELPRPGREHGVTVAFEELDDFHPDRLFDRLEGFQTLRGLRGRLNDQSTFEAAADEVRAWVPQSVSEQSTPGEPPPAETEESPQAPVSAGIDEHDLLNQALDRTSDSTPLAERVAAGEADWNDFIRGIVDPHTIPAPDARLPELLATVDAAVGDLMRGILHHPRFQAVEAAWRGLYWLVRRLETGTKLKLFIRQTPRDQLAAGFREAEDINATTLYKQLVEETVETPGADRWSLIVGAWTFEPAGEDMILLSTLGQLARAAGASFLAAAGDRLLGCRSLAKSPDSHDWQPLADAAAEKWAALRSRPEAARIGLALPRFLLRLPYGKESDPLQRFDFEELLEGKPHEGYLWGNPAFVCALLLGESFSRFGWEMQPGQVTEVENLPLFVYRADGESQIKPCVEVLLTETVAQQIWDAGLMPLCTIKYQDKALLAGFRSISSQHPQLSGPWS